MSGYKLDNTFALCRDMDTNLFYMFEEELVAIGTNLQQLRSLCFRCPIWRECSAYGWQYERYGMFGGVTGEERDAIRRKKWDSPKIKKLQEDLYAIGVNYEQAVLYQTDGKDLLA